MNPPVVIISGRIKNWSGQVLLQYVGEYDTHTPMIRKQIDYLYLDTKFQTSYILQ